MTQTSRDYSDSRDDMECSLAPADKYIYDEMKRHLDQPLCFRDFIKKYAHGTIRNAFSRLKKKAIIRLYCRSGPAFYVCSCSGLTISSKLITVNRMGGGGRVVRRGSQLVVDFL
ncbi:hypothetical protein MUP77_17730, partial [Candidatus Bathyarchaeota archaeon]|nr:hypothetical protein [Candidatus Bathyarchaeota archaeon]